MKSKSWWYSFFAAYKALCMVNANVGSNAYTGTVSNCAKSCRQQRIFFPRKKIFEFQVTFSNVFGWVGRKKRFSKLMLSKSLAQY